MDTGGMFACEFGVDMSYSKRRADTGPAGQQMPAWVKESADPWKGQWMGMLFRQVWHGQLPVHSLALGQGVEIAFQKHH